MNRNLVLYNNINNSRNIMILLGGDTSRVQRRSI